jgi:uncharacterized protein with von Willebrand factor type A (vWA) domain
MKDRLLGFFDALRQAGLTPSVGETLDATEAVRVAGIERPVLRDALAAALIKDHAERAIFDDVFDRYFALPPGGGRARRPAAVPEGEGSGRGGEGEGRGQRRQEGRAGVQPRDQPRQGQDQRARQLARRRALAAKPFREMEPDEIEELDDLVAELGRRFRSRFSRRQRRVRGGRVDMRRTIRRALSRGGVPLELVFRAPRPGKSELLALVDVSYSTATAAEFLLALLAPARRHFRRVTLLAYVDRPCPVSVEGGHVVPHEALDLNARSDFGNVLKLLVERWDVAIGRNTVVLILGDARNNRRPPRADLLARIHQVARRLVWLNPEPPPRWNTGDSVIAAYARHSDAVLAAWNPATLAKALDQVRL